MPLAGNKKALGIMAFAFMIVCSSVCWGQDSKGSEDLDKAFDLKIKSQTTRDLDAVVKLCKSAIDKGLDEEGKVQAEQLAASALFEHAEELNGRIFGGQRDPRWQQYRSEALNRLEKAVEYKPEMTGAHLMAARLNMLPNGDREAAQKSIEKAIQYAGEDREQLSSAMLMRASLSVDKTAQLSDLNQAIKINPENVEAIRVRSLYYLSSDEPEKAMEDLNQLLGSDKVTSQNYIDTVMLLMALGPKFDEKLQGEAVKILDKAIERDSDNANVHFLRAELNVMREKLDEALVDSTRAIELDHKNPKNKRNVDFLAQRASIYLDQEKLDEALVDVNAALEIDAELPRGILLRGMIRMQQEDFVAAIEDIKWLADSSPGNPALQRQLAMLYNAADEPSQAIAIYDKLVEQFSEEKFATKPNNVQLLAMSERSAALRGRGDARLSTGEHAEAIADYNDALNISEELRQLQEQETDKPVPADDGILNNLAWVLATSPQDDVRDGKRAIKLATEAAEATEYKQPHILSTLASGYAETGDFENAIKWIEKAIEVNREEGEKSPNKRNADQKESLQKEFESYKEKKPWREVQNVEKEKAEKAKAAKTKEEKKGAENKSEKSESEKSEPKKSESEKADSKKSDPGDSKSENSKSENPEKEKSADKKSEKKSDDPPKKDDSTGK